ncbi:MAG: ABC transporter permease [Bernardetiaceae bacterium]|nr:ABC transporter permease [Bernardetiaceae bacterium]
MRIIALSLANLRTQPLRSLLSILLLALGVGVMLLLLLLESQLSANFNKNIKGINAVVGAKGSPLQLILSAVYHIDNPTGNISLKEAEFVMNHPLVATAIPLSLGDSHQGFRIVGTNAAYPAHYEAEIAEGDDQIWGKSLYAILGARVAQHTGLKIGDTFVGAHGFEGDHLHEDKPYTVKGILQPKHNVLDGLILTDLQSVWDVHDAHHHHHDEKQEEHEHSANKDITALLVRYKGPAALMFPRQVNDNTNMMAAVPALEMQKLYQLTGSALDIFQALAWILVLFSGFSVFISLWSSLKARDYEMALLRMLGASPLKVFAMVLLEGVILAFVGYLLGWIFSHLTMAAIANYLSQQYHYDFAAWNILPAEFVVGAIVMTLGAVAAIPPAISAARTDIVKVMARH